ncbi:CoA activase, partial [candidate division KSB1 bacterium]|nr:CoA activase [candidate division KSB1 bacterium]
MIHLGLDMGSVSAKLAAILPADVQTPHDGFTTVVAKKRCLSKSVSVHGQPVKAAQRLLSDFFDAYSTDVTVSLNVTGSQGKLVATLLNVPYVNEFKAIARGTIELAPARTIIEIGGDVSRYLKVELSENGELLILDYERNGECAAGTGSFIDQQAVRMNYRVNDIGSLVLQAEGCATIAGRCSVFAKTDMIHAQQRGYSPGAILKGLCEAVVRNFKGTVLRGKHLEPPVVFVGGVAANSGVVAAVRSLFNLTAEELIVPALHNHVGAIGCAVLQEGALLTPQLLAKLTIAPKSAPAKDSVSLKLDIANVRFENQRRQQIDYTDMDYPIRAHLGFDIGSVSTNLVLLDERNRVMDEIYTSTAGKPIQVVQREMARWQKKWGDKVQILSVGATGSGRDLIGELVGADAVHDEITAHKTGASAIASMLFKESVETIFEIGGQDSKFISIDDGVVVDFSMNEACAAGTGSFLEEQAVKLGISIVDDFAALAFSSDEPIRLGERCTVFMEKDVTAYMQQGREVKDIAAGLAYAVVHNYLNRVVRGRHIGNLIYFQGGTAYNQAVAAAFAKVLGKEIVVPPHNGVIGAIGAALLAQTKMERQKGRTRFRGFDLNVDFKIRQFTCKGCSNNCDIQECTIDGEKSYWGDKCSDRYRKKSKVAQKATIADLFKLHDEWLGQDIPGPDGLGIRIGIPKAMYYYDRFPFWRAYFRNIGAQVVISADTTNKLAADGRELCIAEPCFPIIVGHGHYVDLLSKNVDYVFMPQIINSETDTPEKESWVCPWGQTLSLVIRNSIDDETRIEQLLKPVIHFRDGIEYVKREMHGVAKILGVSKKSSDRAIESAYAMQGQFRQMIRDTGLQVLQWLNEWHQQAIVIVGRPYNIYDGGINLHVPDKLRQYYGINVIPMDFLPLQGIKINEDHENMFWNYGRQIMQAAKFVGKTGNLHIIYFTNFKCGPDSYIKHFIRDTIGAPYLTLQFDDHSNDAGILTRCEAYL